MKTQTILLSTALILTLLFSCKQKEGVKSIVLNNASDAAITEALEVNLDTAYLNLLRNGYFLYEDENPVPFEIIDNPGTDAATLLLDMEIPADSQKTLTLKKLPEGESAPEFTKKTQAELWHREGGRFENNVYVDGGPFVRKDYLRVPEGFMDHSYFIKYEGPGWESDKVGYRFYLDWRNAVDVFGKKVPEMVLNNVGQDGFDSYHEPAAWGMDILKVGDGLGVGSIAFWDGEKAVRVAETDSVICEITRDGLLRSQVKTDYYGWAIDSSKYTFSSFITIDAGSRKSHQRLVFDQAPVNICTGIGKDSNAEFFQSSSSGDWNYIATFGKQTLFPDNAGLVILYQSSDRIEITEDELNHVVILKPKKNGVSYYFLAAWEQEPGGITNKDDFKVYLDEQLEVLNNPVEAAIVK